MTRPDFAASQMESSLRRHSVAFCALVVGLGVGCSGTQAPLSTNTQVTAPAKKAAPVQAASSKPSATKRTKPRNLNNARPLSGVAPPLVRPSPPSPAGLSIADDLPALLGKWQARESPLAPLSERFPPAREVAPSWARYFNQIHQQLHYVFARGWLVGLDSAPIRHPLSDQTLRLKVELQIEGGTGQLLSANVLQASEFEPFDVGSLEAIERASPFGPAPAEIIDAEGNVYMHWELHRRPAYACSTYFVTPAQRRTIE